MIEEILGYRQDGSPIHPPKKGYIYTAAFILCSKCNAPISGYGGPAWGSVCKTCHDNEAGKETK